MSSEDYRRNERRVGTDEIREFQDRMGWLIPDPQEDKPNPFSSLESMGEGLCGECETQVRERKRVGRFSLCFFCVGRRLRART